MSSGRPLVLEAEMESCDHSRKGQLGGMVPSRQWGAKANSWDSVKPPGLVY